MRMKIIILGFDSKLGLMKNYYGYKSNFSDLLDFMESVRSSIVL